LGGQRLAVEPEEERGEQRHAELGYAAGNPQQQRQPALRHQAEIGAKEARHGREVASPGIPGVGQGRADERHGIQPVRRGRHAGQPRFQRLTHRLDVLGALRRGQAEGQHHNQGDEQHHEQGDGWLG
jgi:hypothetical protein